MGFPSAGSLFPTSENLNLSTIFFQLLSNLPHLLFIKFWSFTRDMNGDDHDPDHRRSPSLVPVPVYLAAESLKKSLPSMQYGQLVKKIGNEEKEKSKDLICIICMGSVEEKDEIRELCNCSHVFHTECLDAWICEGHVTCPLCRSMLLPNHGNADPWRMERMIDLFGDDYVVDTPEI